MPPKHLEVEPLKWDEFYDWFGQRWEPGQHLSVVAPTGAGKTTLVSQLLGLRRYVLAIDPKGGDTNLSALGWPRLDTWPGDKKVAAMVQKNDAANPSMPSRYLVGPIVRHHSERETLLKTMGETMDGAFNLGGFTVYCDELQLATDPRLSPGIRAKVDRLLVAARDRGVSFVSSYQAPSWVTPHAGRMSTWYAVSYTRDVDTIDKIAGNMGRPRAEMRGAIQGLDPFTWMFVGRDPNAPIVVTKPPEINKG